MGRAEQAAQNDVKVSEWQSKKVSLAVLSPFPSCWPAIWWADITSGTSNAIVWNQLRQLKQYESRKQQLHKKEGKFQKKISWVPSLL